MKKWYDFVCRKEKDYEVSIYDEIGGWGISANELCKEIRAIPAGSKITVGINSPGGNVFDGIAIYNALHRRKNVVCRVDGIAASIASIVLMGGETRIAPLGATVMIHDPSGMVWGKAEDMEKTADVLRKTKNNLVGIYARHTGLDEDKISELMDEETWLNAEEAKEMGFVDEVTAAFSARANTFDLSKFRHPPDGGTHVEAQAGVKPPSVKNKQNKPRMKTLLNTLAEVGLIAKGVEDEAEAVAQVRKNLDAKLKPLENVDKMSKSIVDLHEELEKARADAAEVLIDSAIADGRLTAESKPRWVALAAESGDVFKDALSALPKFDNAPVPPEGKREEADIVARYKATEPGPAREKFRKEHLNELTAALSN